MLRRFRRRVLHGFADKQAAEGAAKQPRAADDGSEFGCCYECGFGCGGLTAMSQIQKMTAQATAITAAITISLTRQRRFGFFASACAGAWEVGGCVL